MGRRREYDATRVWRAKVAIRRRGAHRLVCALVQAVVVLLLGVWTAAADDLSPLLAAPGMTVTLNSTTLYTVGEYALTTDKTILCNGARITSTGGPIRVSGAGVRLTVDHCRIDGTGWALLGALDGAQLVVRNDTNLTGNGANSCLYLKGSTLDVDGGSIDQCMWGVQMENADAALHGTVVTDTMWAIQNVAGNVTVDGGCALTNLDPVNSGAGVSLIPSSTYPTRAATAVIHDSTFTGFGNAVDIQPTAAQGLPPGTAEIVGCTFDGAVYSALAAVDAENVRFIDSRVIDTKTDAVYLQNSTAVIEDSQFLDSLNSGVTFFGCPNGGTIRNSLVSGTAHQGVAVVADPPNNRASHGIRILDNTIRNSAIANVLVDDQSDAIVQGNILSEAPDMSVRLHGSPAATLVGDLFLDSHGGLEIKDGADVGTALSVFTGHDRYGAFAYQNATARFSHCDFHANGQDPATADPSVVADTGARITVGRSSLGPAGARALNSNAGNTGTATYNYWDDSSGPKLAAGGGGSGSILAWNPANGSRVDYEPFLTTAPLEARIHRSFALAADAVTLWEPDVELTLSLTGASGIATVPAGLVAALRLRDTTTLDSPAPPVGTFVDGIVAVWVEFDLLSRAAAGSLRLRTGGNGAAAALTRLDPDGQWVPVTTTWDGATSEIVYAPSDPKALQGVFAFGDGQGCATARTCLEPLLTAALCAEPLDAKRQKAIGRKLSSAIGKLTKAAATTRPPKAARLTALARKVLEAIEKLAAKAAKNGAISPACRDAIGAAMRPALQRIDAGAL